MLKISGGTLKGKILKTSKSPELRPVTSMFRETFFNILGESVKGLKVIELFAGTGLISFEVLSRGGESCVLVEKDKQLIRQLHLNSEAFELKNKMKILTRDSLTFISKELVNYEFDIVFADPPYDYNYINLLNGISDSAREIKFNFQIFLKIHKKQLNIFKEYVKFINKYGSGDVNLIVINSGDLYEK